MDVGLSCACCLTAALDDFDGSPSRWSYCQACGHVSHAGTAGTRRGAGLSPISIVRVLHPLGNSVTLQQPTRADFPNL